jgi:hypothetical protein
VGHKVEVELWYEHDWDRPDEHAEEIMSPVPA